MCIPRSRDHAAPSRQQNVRRVVAGGTERMRGQVEPTRTEPDTIRFLAGYRREWLFDGTPVVLTATARLDRRTLGIRAPRIMIGRYVDITVTAVVRPA